MRIPHGYAGHTCRWCRQCARRAPLGGPVLSVDGTEDEVPSEEPKPAGPRTREVWRYRPGWPGDLASTSQACNVSTRFRRPHLHPRCCAFRADTHRSSSVLRRSRFVQGLRLRSGLETIRKLSRVSTTTSTAGSSWPGTTTKRSGASTARSYSPSGTSIALQHFGWSHSHTNGTGSSSGVPPDSSMAARLAL